MLRNLVESSQYVSAVSNRAQ